MRLKKGMRKALSLALSTALIITSANIGSTKSKAAEATTTNVENVTYSWEGSFTPIDNGQDWSGDAKYIGELTTTKVTDGMKVMNAKQHGDDWMNPKLIYISLPETIVNPTVKVVLASKTAPKDSKKYKQCQILANNVSSLKDEDQKKIDGTVGGWISAALDDEKKKADSEANGVITDADGNVVMTQKMKSGVDKDFIMYLEAGVEVSSISMESTSYVSSVTNKNETVSVDSEKEVTAEVGTYETKGASGSAVVVSTAEIATSAGIKEASLTAKDGKISVNVKAEAVKADTDVKLTGKVAGVEFPVNVKVKAAAADSSATATATNGATTAPTSGPSTTSTAGATATSGPAATNTPAPVTSNTPAPTSDATPAPTEAPKGNMDKFNVGFNYVADESWGEQSWGDKSVDVTGDGKYEISYTAQSDSADIFMMILSTDLYKGSLNKDFKLVPTTVSVGKTDYKVNAKGGWCFADQEETNAYRYNIVNPYNGPIGSDGVTYVDPAVTSIDGLGTAPVKKGDTIKVSFTVSGMKGSTSAKSKAKVTVSKKTVTVAAGKSTTVSYKALNKAGKAVKASAKTSNKKLATVKVTSSKKIKISVPKKATKGSSAKITLTSAGKKATITVKVANPVKSAKAAKKTVKIKKGKKAKITVKVTAQNKKKATTDKLTAKSSKSKIAKITGKKVSKGKVTVTVKGAKKGTSKLTIKIGKKSVKVTVKVK